MRFSQTVQRKFLILLLLTSALVFDMISRQPNAELLEDKSLSEMPAAR